MSKKSRVPRTPKLPEELATEGRHLRNAINRGSALSCALIAAAVLERAVMSLLNKNLVQPKKSEDGRTEYQETTALFDISNNGLLSSFSSCYKMAYCLGLIDTTVYENLKAVGNIRNRFAHSHQPIDFLDDTVNYWCERLKFPPADAEGIPKSYPRKVRATINRNIFSLAVLTTHNQLLLTALSTVQKEAPVGWTYAQTTRMELRSDDHNSQSPGV